MKNYLPRLDRLPSKGWMWLLAGLALAGSSLYVFIRLANDILQQETVALDAMVFALVHAFSSPFLDTFMLWVTYSGTGISLMFLSIPVLAWLYFQERKTHTFVLFFLANLGGALLNTILKAAYHRERPLLDDSIGATGYSLPSGHAMCAIIFYGFLAYIIIRCEYKVLTKVLLCSLCVLAFLLIGLSRIYLNAHYFTDVIAGYLAGLFWLTTCILALETSPWHAVRFKGR